MNNNNDIHKIQIINYGILVTTNQLHTTPA